MLELLILGTFCVCLLFCVLLDFSILYALVFGLILFLLYGKKIGCSWKELAVTSLSGIKTVKNILFTFLLIGILTSLWRDAGTIPVIVCYATKLISPPIFLLMTFLLNCFISVLTGTAFGTAATMGIICATMASSMNINLALVGGVILSGVFFGDRCSPVSTSALLVAELTKTSIFNNIKNMIRSSLIPFFITCGIYLVMGLLLGTSEDIPELQTIFSREFSLSWVALLPAVVILLLSLFQVNVKKAMSASILTALPICLLVQNTQLSELPALVLTGYQTADPELSVMLNGGGIFSMVKVAAIVCFSSSYSGIFQKTGLLNKIQDKILVFCKKTTPYTAIFVTSIFTGMLACNQTLSIMLSHQLCKQTESNPETMANHLEDSAVVIAPLIPWSIAGAVPLATVGAPTGALGFACFLYVLPLWRLLKEIIKQKKHNQFKHS